MTLDKTELVDLTVAEAMANDPRYDIMPSVRAMLLNLIEEVRRLNPPGASLEWNMRWDGHELRFSPCWDLKVGENAWPFPEGQYVRVREIPEE